MNTETIVVFDVGKTNKKLMVYDRSLKLIDSRYRRFDCVDEDGVEVEPMDDIERWLFDTLAELARDHTIIAIAISTHGASFALLDDSGARVLPVVSYTHDPDPALHDRFYAAVGDRADLQRTTATVEIKPLINPGKLLFFEREQWPERFARARHLVMLPQYFAALLTGRTAIDFTSIGCHSYFWDFEAWDYSSVTRDLGITELFREKPRAPWEVLGTVSAEVAGRTGLSGHTIVTLGIHDSNAALLPYLVKRPDERFVLNSTGTWCVAMNPFALDGDDSGTLFAPEEIGKTVFYNISAFGKPVKTAILMGGVEYETYRSILRDYHATDDIPAFNPSLCRRIIEARTTAVIPGIARGTGQFPDSRARIIDGDREYDVADVRSGAIVPPLFQDLAAAHATLNLSLALQSVVALRRVGLEPGMSIYVEGGFRHNIDYNVLLASFLPDNPVFLTTIDEASAFGAALTARAALADGDPMPAASDFEIERYPVSPESFAGLRAYEEWFLAQI